MIINRLFINEVGELAVLMEDNDKLFLFEELIGATWHDGDVYLKFQFSIGYE